MSDRGVVGAPPGLHCIRLFLSCSVVHFFLIMATLMTFQCRFLLPALCQAWSTPTTSKLRAMHYVRQRHGGHRRQGDALHQKSRSEILFCSKAFREDEFIQSESIHSTIVDDGFRVSLADRIRQAYQEQETDGIVELASRMDLQNEDPLELLQTSTKAANQNKVMLAGIMNGLIGACCLLKDGGSAVRLLETYDELSEEIQVYPDIVTLCLAYTAVVDQEEYHEIAESILYRATKMSKKQGGSKRRKSLAASKRHPQAGVQCREVEQHVQELLGSDEFQVLQETDNLLVVSKPSGVVCYHKKKTASGRIKRSKKKSNIKQTSSTLPSDISLEDALLHCNIPLSTLSPEGRGMVHRIDRGTSGCIVLAKDDDMHARLVTEFFLRRAQKAYQAVVALKEDDGDMPPEGFIDSPVQGRPAKSKYSIIERHGDLAASVRVETFTGRKHQVRVHLAEALGQPILLDPLYGPKNEQELPRALSELINEDGRQRFFLHSSELSIPTYNVQVQSPIPTWWRSAISELSQQ
jgi:23S rRNA-/tRNA-specific pseudouridylate synthase